MKIPVNKKWLKSITEICKDPLKKLVNNEGMNNVCLYNFILHIYVHINKTHAFKQNKKLDDLVQDICFASQSFMLRKVMVTTKDTIIIIIIVIIMIKHL